MLNKRRLLLFIMLLLLPVTLNYFSPYVIIDGLANKILAGAFFVWLLMFVSSLFVGRAFCSYICPYGGLQMSVDLAIKKSLKQVRWMRGMRYVLGILWVTPIIILTALNIGNVKVDPFYLTENFVSVDNIFKLIGYYVIVFALLILPLLMGKRASCHYLCPMSILNVTGTKVKNRMNISSLRLTAASEKCTGCNQCSKACPMSLNVTEMVKMNKLDSLDCILCGECCSVCKSDVLKRKMVSRNKKTEEQISAQL
ncbi:MAG TPA: 4Fe-4S binding protein [Patescibacteria group bacterium]|nr:4Fe-4S binding protein [Patescibacteria group bacterium]